MTDELRLKSLLQRGLVGDQDAYRAFLAELSVLLERQIRRQLATMGQSENYAEDVVQEALIAVHTKRHTYDGQTPVTAWARAIARYKLVDFLRTRARAAAEVPFDETFHEIAADGTTVENHELKRMMHSLPEKQRQQIELMKVAGYSSAETARLTGSTEAAVRTNVHRGLKALARMWRR